MNRRYVALTATAFIAASWPQPALGGSSPRADVGRIIGTVEVSSALTARRPRFRIYNDAGPGAVPPPAPRSDIASELHNVVVYVGGDGRGARLASAHGLSESLLDSLRHGVMSQTQETFTPHVLSIMRGGRVDFPNADDVYHNVFSLSRTRTFDLGRYPTGSSKSVTFGKPGVVQVFCHIHSDMSGIVFVLPNPFFARPDSAGTYTIENVPAGEYTLIGWHERTRPVAVKVRVTAGTTARIDFNLPLERPPEP